MKIGLLAILLLLSLSVIILNVGPVFTEGEITHGQRIYENIREVNADSLPIAVNEDDGRALIRFIETEIIGEWRARFFLVAFSFLVFIVTLGVILVEYREKAKKKHDKSRQADAATLRP